MSHSRKMIAQMKRVVVLQRTMHGQACYCAACLEHDLDKDADNTGELDNFHLHPMLKRMTPEEGGIENLDAGKDEIVGENDNTDKNNFDSHSSLSC